MSLSKVVRGEGSDAYLLGDPYAPSVTGGFTTTTPVASATDLASDLDGLSLALIVDYAVDQIAVISGTDAVVASTGVWTFGNYTFTGLIGAKLVVSGAANAGNNGTFAITAVSGHTATTATTGLVNETFGPSVVVYVVHSETASKPAGSWKIFASNDFAPGVSPPAGLNDSGFAGQYGQGPNNQADPNKAAHWTDITTQFSVPAMVTEVADASAQIVSPPGHFSHRHYYVQFTPTSGKGTCRVARFSKSWGH